MTAELSAGESPALAEGMDPALRNPGPIDPYTVGLRLAVEEGATHLAAWSFRATETMSSIRPARPDIVWSVLGESFRKLRAAEREN